MSRWTKREAEAMVDLVLSQYLHVDLDTVGSQEHFDKIAAVYGETIEGEPFDDQMADMGAIIAVLYWRAARAEAALREALSGVGGVGGVPGGGGLSSSVTATTGGQPGGGGGGRAST